MFRYKIDILKALADNGYNTSRLRKDLTSPNLQVTIFL